MTEEPRKPFVTIAIVSCEDEPRIEACLRSAAAQDYPAERVEILVADGMSMDATREHVLRFSASDPRIVLLDNPQRTRAAALNTILGASRGEIVVPMDPSGEYGTTHVTKCVDALSSSPAEHLAIVPRSAGTTLVERALSAVEKTRLAFAAGTELAVGEGGVPAILGAVKRGVFERVGLFDPDATCEEDVELAHRIASAGGGLTVRSDIVVHKREARSLKELLARHYRLGRDRARRTVKEGRVEIRTFAPLVMVSAFGALAATSTIQPVTPLALAAYALVTGAAAVRVGAREGLATIPVVWVAYPVMHLGHGVGFAAGLARAVLRREVRPFVRAAETKA